MSTLKVGDKLVSKSGKGKGAVVVEVEEGRSRLHWDNSVLPERNFYDNVSILNVLRLVTPLEEVL